jgi:hypothetical protein
MAQLSPVQGIVETAVHFENTDPLDYAQRIEREGRERGLNTGAFVAACWIKPG